MKITSGGRVISVAQAVSLLDWVAEWCQIIAWIQWGSRGGGVSGSGGRLLMPR
ncbi:hypothetical protein LPH50_09445 [Xylella taiwanensis]|uniref:Uncharacterized protein n=1 Tax=Xylella taiwanensis TaxID=1444770 RepID=A0ABS8TX94_9GAMM|nr:hypothetical protein [Xylella taiwanensis]MCD8456165.1 hypothetical protein [Xylella taiwanensis]MCD8458573.1 hypothetical protein [Xylella taiwanensis]MCD8460707.1 hypothetical protein [Xylella taiwanensis]MCD8463231.1 hypothetical protein [Xylella taiwanensis]MCD8465212.1 hypothetical protein [Xylella taiwanensis]